MDDCIEWTSYRTANGYGSYGTSRNGVRRKFYAHRWAWAVANGMDPWDLTPDMVIRHTCDNRPCVNPDHLVMGTTMDNIRDRMEKGRSRGRYSDVTHCVNGHEFTPENTYFRKRKQGGRRCRECTREEKRVARLLGRRT